MVSFLNKSWFIQIEITDHCHNDCAHCSRGTELFKESSKSFYSLDYIENALISLKRWAGGIGCFGGEPTLHPDFLQICKIYQKYVPKTRCGIWTSGGKYFDKYRTEINNTFGNITFNSHQGHGYHQPPFISGSQIFSNEKKMNKKIENCWIADQWSAIITPRGAFFCEIASTIDKIYQGNLGVSPCDSWWEKKHSQLLKQKNEYCQHCGMAFDIPAFPEKSFSTYVSRNIYDKMLSNKSCTPISKRVEVIDTFDQIKSIKNGARPLSHKSPRFIQLIYFLTFGLSHCGLRGQERWYWAVASRKFKLTIFRNTIKCILKSFFH